MPDETEETKPVGKLRPGKKKKLGAGKNLLVRFYSYPVVILVILVCSHRS